MAPRSLFDSLAMVWLLMDMDLYSSAWTTITSVRFATRRANSELNTIMAPVRRLPSATRPSGPFRLKPPVPEDISDSMPVPWSLARMRKPRMMKLANSEEPPCETKGRVRPVSGIRRVTPPTMMKACSTMMAVKPTAMNELTSLLARTAIRMPRMEKHRYSSRTPAAPSRPVSSAMAEKMKSDSTMGICEARPLPMPTPNSPPSASEKMDCTSW